MRTFNLLFWPTVLLALLLVAAGWRVGTLRARPWQRAVLWAIAVIAFLPASLYAAYYAHVLDRAAWFYDLRALPFSELAASGAGLGVGLVSQRLSRLAAVRASAFLVRFVPGFLVLLLVLLLAVPYAKPVIVPLPLSPGDHWRQGVCIQSTPSTCGPASAVTLLHLYGKQATEREIARECFTCGTGTENWYLARALRHRGLPVAVRITRPQPDWIPYPSIAGTQLGGPGGSGHFIVILGEMSGHYLVGDPLSGRMLITPDKLRARYLLTGFFLVPSVPPPPPSTSEIRNPGDPFELHGRIQVFRYPSPGGSRRVHIYTPPGYDTSPNRRYPVLFLMHGSPGDDSNWTQYGNVAGIMDRLIATGACIPAIVVMPKGPDSISQSGMRTFERDLFEHLMPWVERRFRVKQGAAARAIAGLSMGGFEAIRMGLCHPDRFAWIGVFSAGLRAGFISESDLKALGMDRDRLVRSLRLVYVRIGTRDFLLQDARRLRKWLKRNDINHVYQEVPGTHEWPVWRSALEDFTQRLFR